MFEDVSVSLTRFGLQQIILDMHFIYKIANFRCYSSKVINQSVSSIITCAINEFTARGIDLNSALLEDEWFIDITEATICKLCRKGAHNNLEEAFVDYQKIRNFSSSKFSFYQYVIVVHRARLPKQFVKVAEPAVLLFELQKTLI